MSESLKCFSWWHIHLLLRKVDFITKWSQNFRNFSKPKMLGLREEPPELLEHNFSEIKAMGCPGMGCAPWLHYGHTWRLSSCVFLLFQILSLPQRSWQPSFASKAWREQDSHAAVLLKSTVMCWKFTGNFSQGESSIDTVCCLKISDQLLWVTIWCIPESHEASSVLLLILIMLWSWNSVCCVFWESLYWGLANRAPCVTRAGCEPTAQQLSHLLMDGAAQSCCSSFTLHSTTFSSALGWLPAPFSWAITWIPALLLVNTLIAEQRMHVWTWAWVLHSSCNSTPQAPAGATEVVNLHALFAPETFAPTSCKPKRTGSSRAELFLSFFAFLSPHCLSQWGRDVGSGFCTLHLGLCVPGLDVLHTQLFM